MVNVNNLGKLSQSVNVKLGKHMKAVLLHLYNKKGYIQRQDTIIRAIYDLYDHERADKQPGHTELTWIRYPLPISRSLRASMCRAFTILEKEGLIFRQNYQYKYDYSPRLADVQGRDVAPSKIWFSKPWFGIAEKGIEYVNNSAKLSKVLT